MESLLAAGRAKRIAALYTRISIFDSSGKQPLQGPSIIDKESRRLKLPVGGSWPFVRPSRATRRVVSNMVDEEAKLHNYEHKNVKA